MMMVSNISGEMWPKFGGARLPNDLEMTNRANGLCNRIVRVRRLARRAVGTSTVQLFDLDSLRQLRGCTFQTWQTLGQRLGGRFGLCHVQRSHMSWVSTFRRSRSGASPHQSSGGASPLMTITKTFVTYFKHPIVSL